MPEAQQTTGQAENPQGQEGQPPSAMIDIEELVNRVYKLMREEARLEHARGASVTQGRKR